MRKRQSFLLTIFSAENETPSFCGRVKVISSGKTRTFTTMDELYSLIAAEMDEDLLQKASSADYAPNQTEPPGPIL